MDINTSYDKHSGLLTIRSGLNDGQAKTAGTTTATSAKTSTTGQSATQNLNLDSAYISPVLQAKLQTEALQTQFTKTLAAKFEELGIDVSRPITLTQGADGKVTVAGDHPDKEAIEKLFTDVPTLSEAFTALSKTSSDLAAMTSNQSASLVRTNGYAAYLKQIQSTASSGDFFYSYMDGAASTYFQ
ncbi:MAG: hypothetical protein B193_3071 [Solidesulfovibrio magneticus str. Maddingley MBC34]|uniref:Uncharacterized protein n=1 Tax=Solidesulfovibrio magneticus str. Maddingley MBC34 TaxID=1206767 RepID=K6GAV5_9BACT|nr:MAG: hypothetical protein B193_3071 [Solidesulfovibrio magneticus str. Maddingley MBC34]